MPLQLVFRGEIDLDPPAFALADDADARAEREARAALPRRACGRPSRRLGLLGWRRAWLLRISASVSRTESCCAMTSRARRAAARFVGEPSSARAWPIDSAAARDARRGLRAAASAAARSSRPTSDPCRPRRRSAPASAGTRRRAGDRRALLRSGSDPRAGCSRSARRRGACSSGMSRTTTGTLSRPARCAARQRRSPAMIS